MLIIFKNSLGADSWLQYLEKVAVATYFVSRELHATPEKQGKQTHE